MVSFALGTDTAGSGRIPAAFNNIVGCKPTRGLFSAAGVVPACRSLDCVSVFAADVDGAARVFAVLDLLDPADPCARDVRTSPGGPARRQRIGVPLQRNLEFFGDREYQRLFGTAVERLAALDLILVEVDVEPFIQAGALLYDGPWVAERYAAVGEFISSRPQAVHPVVRDIIARGAGIPAVDAFRGMYRLGELRRAAAPVWSSVDALMLPTAGTIYRIAEVEHSPVALNTNLGRYTNFVNLLDLAALALPAGFRRDGLPFGITFLAPALSDGMLFGLGARWEGRLTGAGATVPSDAGSPVRLAVVGAHLSGQPLNGELTGHGARLIRSSRTAPLYRLYALAGTRPPKPGLVRGPAGAAIEVEIWEMSAAAFGAFVAGVPSPLSIGTLLLEDGEQVHGFLCESFAVHGARDISAFSGWRAFLRENPAKARTVVVQPTGDAPL
jgi:allophanate hydrolase